MLYPRLRAKRGLRATRQLIEFYSGKMVNLRSFGFVRWICVQLNSGVKNSGLGLYMAILVATVQ
jgi:hypothetical protein